MDKYPLFCPKAALKEIKVYINTTIEVKSIKTKTKLSDHNLKVC